MIRKNVLSILVGLVLTFSAAGAQALNYTSTDPGPFTLAADQFQIFTFAAAPGALTSAILNLDVLSATDSIKLIASKTFTSPPSGQIFSEPVSSYLFTTDLKIGANLLNMNNYLAQLNAGSGPIYLGLLMDRGAVSINQATLSGTVAPEPVSMALVGAGLVLLPFARRFRKTMTS